MPKLLQINVTANWGSTGKIAEQIGVMAQEHGWESYIAYGRSMNPSKNKLIKIGSMLDVYEHYFENRFFDNEGRASRRATKKFLKEIDKMKPDVVHLHNIHDHYLNFSLLFRYLAEKHIPVVWTLHDLWAMTGHCAFNLKGCEKWKKHCSNCPMIETFSLDRSRDGYQEKKQSFTSIPTMTIVPVSEWLGAQVMQSFLKKYSVQVIKNGIDINVFRPTYADCLEHYGLSNTKFVIAVASIWPESKGLADFINIRQILDKSIKIVLVGLSEHQISQLPNGIVGIPRTQSQVELAQLYSAAEALVSLSGSETFGLTIVEALACGTPAIVYNNTAQRELVTVNTGSVIANGDYNQVASTISNFVTSNFKAFHSDECRNRAIEYFDKNKSYLSHIQLYSKIREGKIVLLGVAFPWSERKGLQDYLELSRRLDDRFVIILVGLSEEQMERLPSNVIGLQKTQDQNELAELYSMSDILLSLSYGETFGMTMAEAYACGTPCLVYDNTAQPEIITPNTGRIAKTGDIDEVARLIYEMAESNFKAKHTTDCRLLAEQMYDKNKSFKNYIDLYESLI